ncbi:PAS domain-containing protein [Allosphingosinicella deserti]|uniref:histidine kinase n=1 Tax=Allosphingosinicella deserti TaxID=2116704 RepID=A0A2P7QV49_9SPHN|nr:PAS domain-containing protein [Sphingomonas deserti]PSJ41820.1 hypothetical protein C7I55_05980 [Sphingomonas deserti]
MTAHDVLDTAFIEAVHNHDWRSTSLGPRADWPAPFAGAVEIVLRTHHPMFVCWGPDLPILFNEAFAEILGPQHRSALGVPLRALWANEWHRFGSFVEAAMAGRSSHAEDVPFLTWRSDYTQFGYFSFSYTPLLHEGRVGGVLCVCTETTERVLDRQRVLQERDRLHAFFEQSPSLVAISLGPDHVYEFVNSAYEAFVGRPREQLLGRALAQIFPEVVGTPPLARMDEVFRTGRPVTVPEVHVQVPERPGQRGLERIVNWVAHPYRAVDGSVAGVFRQGHDVTEQRTAEQNVQQLTAELIHVSRLSAMGTMASTLAHELNQPLTAIANYASVGTRLLGRRGATPDDPLAEALAAIRSESLRAGDLIRRLRQMCMRGPSATERVDVERLVADALRLALLSFGEPPELNIDIAPGLAVLGDPIQLQQVLINLVRNAAEAMEGRSERRLGIRASEHEGSAELCVTDTGPGLSNEIAARLFEPFSSTKSNGMGVGLSITRTIVEAHGGRIDAVEVPGGGCAFCFTLPIAHRPDRAA